MRAALATRRIVLSISLLVALLGMVARAHGQDSDTTPIKPEARARFARGLEYYKMKEYEAAISEFEAAFAIDPRNEILFAQAQAERLSGDCASAVVLYRRFLEHNPPAVHAEAARTSLDKCEVALRSTPEGARQQPSNEPPPPATPPPLTPAENEPPARTGAAALPPRPDDEHARPASRPFWKDPLGDTFAAAGLIAVGVGVGFYVASSSDVTAAADANRYSDHARLLDRAEQRRTFAIVGLGAGSALLIGAAVRWWWPSSRSQGARTDVALDLRSDGATLVLAGSFP